MTTGRKSKDVKELICATAQTFDIPGQAVIGTTVNGSIVYWNDSAAAMYGWSRGEVMGRDVLSVTPSDITREAATQIMNELVAGRTWTGKFRVRDRDGHEMLALVRDVPVRDDAGTIVGIVGISAPLHEPGW